jgi:DNA-binding beta-propeller fold protein YncE
MAIRRLGPAFVVLSIAWGVLKTAPEGTSKLEAAGPDRLVGYQSLPNGAMCMVPPGRPGTVAADRWERQAAGSARVGEARSTVSVERNPVRMIQDPYPTLSAVAVDPESNEVVATDENLFQILAYGRLANTPTTAAMTEPKWRIAGDRTGIEFICGLHLDQPTGDIYAIYGDVPGIMHVFSRKEHGNVPPIRELQTGGELRGRGLAVDDEHQEMFLVSQHNSAVAVFRKQAAGDEAPIRLLQGDRTRLANPHGIALDRRNDLIFVTNHGQVSSRSTAGADLNQAKPNMPLGRDQAVLGSGRFLRPSITVHRRSAQGDEPALRVIEGARTQLNWPAGIVVDERRGELFVANDTGNSVLVFRADAEGDAAPIRVLKGPNTALASPVGLFLDTKNDELWVANYGNHALTVYSPTAEGNTRPRRIIRTAPLGSEALMIGNPGAVAYDTKREEILVPN